MLFFSVVYGKSMQPFQYIRLCNSLVLGVFCTHFIRFLIRIFSLKPPIHGHSWIRLLGIVLFVVCLYSILNSGIVELAHLYDPRHWKLSFLRRILFNLLNDGPIILVWVAIYFVWHYVNASTKSELDKVRLESMVKELELKTIKAHINPHFIFNALNSIRALVDEDPQRARTAITSLSNILRSSMQAEKVRLVPLERDLNIVKDYLALEHVRFEERLQVVYDIQESCLKQAVPPMMLQTLVENAIKHGISRRLSGGKIKISAFTDAHSLYLKIRNTGTLQFKTKPYGGFGISGVQNQLNLLFGQSAKIMLEAVSPDEVEASVRIPLVVEGLEI